MASQPAHTHLVKTLYRQIIKLQLHWIIDLTRWRGEALATRRLFESSRDLKDPNEIAAKVKEAQHWLKEHWHPEPYAIPTQQGGSSYQRNVAPPIECLSPLPLDLTNLAPPTAASNPSQ